MAEATAIGWTKSTFNPWIGCTEVSKPGCGPCYAREQDKRKRWGGTTHWGPGVPRHRTAEAYWRQPLTWNRQAPETTFAGRKGFWPVFGGSLCDPFDNEAPDEWRADYWALIDKTPNLTWQLVTKRVGNAKKMLPSGWLADGMPKNLWLIISIVNQEEANRDVPKLVEIGAAVRGVSYEPAVDLVDFSEWLYPFKECATCPAPDPEKATREELDRCCREPELQDPLIQWIITGGMSAQGCYPTAEFDMQWCLDVGLQAPPKTAVFNKQMGSRPVWKGKPVKFIDRAGADPAEWPKEFRRQEFPA